MSGILDQIDDTLDNWRGSNDSMRWTPDVEHEAEGTSVLALMEQDHAAMLRRQQDWWEGAQQATADPQPSLTGLWFDKQGDPLTATQANRLLGDWEYKTVGRTRIRAHAYPRAKLLVSTVWLGVNHAFLGGPPILFETMVFGAGSEHHEQMWRWGTEAQAIAGHAAVVALLGTAPLRGLGPSALNAKYHRRYRNRMGRR